jgi:uncharacterized protein YjbI with pentapeptide repeats
MTEVDWTGIDLSRATLSGVRPSMGFRGGNVDRLACVACDFSGLTLEGVKGEILFFRAGRLAETEVLRCDLPQWIVQETDCRKMRVKECKLPRAGFSGGDFSGASFTDCDLSGASLSGVAFCTASFVRVDLQKAGLAGADLSAATLEEVNAAMADFSHVRLPHARLQAVDLRLADGHNVDFSVAMLKNCRLEGLRPTDKERLAAEQFSAGAH